MKIKFSQFVFAVLICFSFCNFAFGQTKAVALKFWEYSEKNGANLDELTNKTKQFAKKLKQSSKTTKGFIFYYTELGEKNVKYCSKDKLTAEKRSDFVRNLLISKYKISPRRIISKDASLRDETELEFWLVPNDAEIPRASPNAYIDCVCPTLSIDGEAVFTNKNNPLTFTANASGGAVDDFTYEWNVSAGKIINGQGTPTIQLDLSKTNVKEVTASIELKTKCCFTCYSKESFITKISQ